MKFQKHCVVVAIAFLTLVASTSRQRGLAIERQKKGRLELTTRILAERYCLPNTLELTLELNFTNHGNESLILYKESSTIGAYMVSRDSNAAENKDYEVKVSPMKTLVSSGFRPGLPEESRFIILKPSQAHILERIFYLNLPENTYKNRRSLIPGNHVLQLSVWTWYYQSTMVNEYREQWKEKGLLWSDTTTSEPMPFNIASGRKGIHCTE